MLVHSDSYITGRFVMHNIMACILMHLFDVNDFSKGKYGLTASKQA